MTLGVPKVKGVDFAKELFDALSGELTDLKMESGKWPDSIHFGGSLGQELYDFIMAAEWEFSQFGPKAVGGSINRIRLEYSKPVHQIEDRGTILDQSFNERRVNGIPGQETMARLASVYSTPAFTIERQIRPYREIRLKRC